MSATIVRTNPTEFKGYPVDLLRGLKGLGPALVDDPALYAAAMEYNENASSGASGSLGPALLTPDCRTVVKGSNEHTLPPELAAPPKAPDRAPPPTEGDPWDQYDLSQLLDLVRQHGVEIPGRVKTPGKLIAALEAAGVTP